MKDKHEIFFVIKSLKRGDWYYYRDIEVHDRQWDIDLYVAKKFTSYEDAEDFLINAFKTKYWGGYFEIYKYFVNR